VQHSSILVIDDDPITCEVLGSWCLHQGAACTTVGSLHEAEFHLNESVFDLVLCDVHLPGNRKLGWVRALTQRPNAPTVVMITGNPELESTLAAANLSIGGYLIKPLDFAALRALVQRLLDVRHRQRQLAELSRSAAELLSLCRDTAQNLDPQLRTQLHQLADRLQSQSQSPAETDSAQPLRQSLVEAIAVLEKTKHSFRSKELGALRRRLEQTLAAELAPA